MPSERHTTSQDPILAAARSLALDIGFRRTTIADLARRAGVSRMTIYRQYADLNAIWSALLTGELVAELDGIAAELVGLGSGRERVVTATTRVTDAIAHHPLFRRALDLDPELVLPLVVDRFGSTQRAALERLTEEIGNGQRDGSIRPDLAAPMAALAVLLTAQSFVFSARVVDGVDNPAAVRQELASLIERYLAS